MYLCVCGWKYLHLLLYSGFIPYIYLKTDFNDDAAQVRKYQSFPHAAKF